MRVMSDSEPKRRWIGPTPGWVVVFPLAATGFLFLSERLQLFPFNRHKGLTVLIAVAGIGVTFLVALLWLFAALLLRLRFQFSIRSALLLMVAVALTFGWLQTEITAPGNRLRR